MVGTRFLYRPKDIEEISNKIIKIKTEGELAVQAFLRERIDANKALKSVSSYSALLPQGTTLNILSRVAFRSMRGVATRIQ